MGIMDFVKSGVREMMIARPDDKKELVVYKHPDQNIPFWSQLTVDSDEVCLFFKDGQYVGGLGPGRHTLQTQNIPFLNNIINKFTGGDVFIAEIFFVTSKPLYNQGFGGPIGSMRDPELDIRVNPRAFGTYSYKVADPVKFVLEFIGQTGAADPDRAMQWVRDQLIMGLKTTLTRLIKAGDMTMMDLGTAGPDVARAIVQDCPDLAKIGVQVMEIAKLNINLSDEDQARIDEFQDQIVQAKIDARKAKIGVSQAEAQAQQRQFELDQDFANRARYVNQLDMGRYQQYAGAEAMMGMGQGMAQGGESAGGGMAAAGMMAGMGMGAGMMYGQRAPYPGYPPQQGYPPQGYPPPGYGPPPGYPPQQGAPPGYPPPGYGPPPGYPPQQGAPPGYPPGYGPPQGAPPQGAPPQAAPPQAAPPQGAPPGAPPGPAPAGAACGKCGATRAANAKFCAECGTPAG
jgi:membrane protease subunit (stomatin/prohibitin family)